MSEAISTQHIDLDLDLSAVKKEMSTLIQERDQSKAYCRQMMSSLNKAKQIMNGQNDEIKALKKNRDPQIVREIMDMTTKAKAEHGMKDITGFMKIFEDV